MIQNLRTKFIAFTMALVFIMLCIIFGTIYGFTASNLERDSLQMMRSASIRPVLPKKGTPSISVPYLVIRQNRRGEWSAHGSDYYDLEDKVFLTGLIEAVSTEKDRDGVLKTYNMRYLRMDGPSAQYVFMDISAEQSTLRHLVRTCVFIGFLSLLVFFAIVKLLANVALKPVERAWAQQKQFVADASHELKTPLAVILTNAELLADPAYSPEEQHTFGQNILTMSKQMRQLVENLLELARLDSITPTLQPLDISHLAANVLLPFEPVLFEQDLMLESHLTPGLWVKGSASHLQQVIEIFLDNARKYADPGTVTVRLDKAGSHALLQVENPGTPLTAEQAKDIFRRFYRVDPSRNRSGSYGLGLSIAETIVYQHGGKIWAEGTQTGNRFSVLIPLCHREAPELPQ